MAYFLTGVALRRISLGLSRYSVDFPLHICDPRLTCFGQATHAESCQITQGNLRGPSLGFIPIYLRVGFVPRDLGHASSITTSPPFPASNQPNNIFRRQLDSVCAVVIHWLTDNSLQGRRIIHLLWQRAKTQMKNVQFLPSLQISVTWLFSCDF